MDTFSQHELEVLEGKRFKFGKNWLSFIKTLNSERIGTAEKSLKEFLKCESLKDKTFIDIGSGSGLFSLAAKNLGANVFSFDYDGSSVESTQILKEKYYPTDENWKVVQGSVLDNEFLNSLGTFDIVYSWGVLHHTGSMWNAIQNIIPLVKPDGEIFIALYNDQGPTSKKWLKVKQIYNKGFLGKLFISSIFISYFLANFIFYSLKQGHSPFKKYRDYKQQRGMSVYHDWHDWLGGLPFEVASNEKVVDFFNERGFYLKKIRTNNGLGCNQYLFKKLV
jgi:2-polyprenyl-3-methyl-5-hydroxy-6-metoxy-1,4-benzoquinol methylase